MKKKKELIRDKWIRKFGAENVYNKNCEHLTDDYECSVKMDMLFCGNKCAYATNVNGTNKVNKRGKVIGLKSSDVCVICGNYVPEGRMICNNCEKRGDKNEK